MKWAALAAALALVVLAALGRFSDGGRAARATPAAGEDRGPAGQPEAPDRGPTAAAEVTVVPAGPETVVVEVVSLPGERPVAGARVEAIEGESVFASAVTDDRGLASVTVDRLGGKMLVASRRGFIPATCWLFEEDEGTPTIVLRPGFVVDGLVTLLDAGPAAGAQVFASWGDNTCLPLRADARGRFEIPGAEAGGWVNVLARHDGYVPVRVLYSPDPASPRVEIVLGRGGRCEGRVVDEAGRPVPDAQVWIGDWPVAGAEVRTDAEGRFAARGLPDGKEHRVHVHTADHRSGLSEPFTCGPDYPLHRCEIVVRPYARVAVTLTVQDGSPVVDATLCVSAREGYSDQRWCAAVAGTPGLFASGPVEPGDAELRVHVSGWPYQTRKIRIAPGVRNDIAYRLEEGLSIAGVVLNSEGRPLRGIGVTFGTVAQALTDAEGRFRIRGLGDAEGALVFADEDPRYLPLTMAARPGQSALRAVLERRPRIVGRLDALPASRLQQTLMGWGDECTGRAVRVGRDGRFELPSVPAGREFWLMLENEGRIPWIFLGLKLAPDETLDLGVLRLPEGLTLRGTVTDKSGMPIANADVRAWSGIENLEWGCSARTDAEGRFAIPDLADIPFEVTVEVPDYVPKSLGIARAGSAPPLAIVLERGGVLEIRGADGDVEVEPLGGGERVTVPTNGGNADVTLPPGRYRIDAETFEIRVGDTTRIELGD